MFGQSATNAYKSVRQAAIVEGNTPHGLISQLYEASLKFLSTVNDREDIDDNTRRFYLNKCLAVVLELQSSLYDVEGSEVSGNLFMLYRFIVDQIMLAKNKDETADLAACIKILTSLQTAWDEIAPGMRST